MSIQNHLPVKSKHLKKTEKISVATGRVPTPIYTSVLKIIKEDGYSWSEFMTAVFTSFLEERGTKVK